MKPHSTIEDFLQDKSFVAWVCGLDPTNSHFWSEMALDKEKGPVLSQARLILQELHAAGEEWEEQEQLLVLAKIHKNLQYRQPQISDPITEISSSKLDYRRNISKVLFFVFASLIVFLAVDVVRNNEGPESAIAENETHWITKYNPQGQKSKIHLPDGSTVIINADSEIKYSSDFGVNNREIYLTGESFFEVAPDSLLPFRVFTGNIVTTALGTSFNIQSYKPDRVNVQLATGKVEVVNELDENQLVFLQPGEQVTANGSQKFVKGSFNPQKAFLWKSGILLFDKVSFSEFALTLERWYGVEIDLVNTPARGLKISGEFKETYLSNVLESIGYAYGFNYKIDQKKVKLVFTP
ncbi:FecR family protein [Cyclobacterium jeungdonense]|uniref:FecR domain-containing protein n=1 Tax=Cyclobacterium jeungdonense TaxID=708087 RepID=A0ABT8C9J8_9BACT|nr:FecR domain-containing protein [Cyclobacterium jeungdonense]MDN3689449.1 FecR domain-containing protein [Cyclobacterium jeungdonense]